MRRIGFWLVGLSLVGCAGTGTSPLDNQPGTRFNSAGANGAGGRGTATSIQELKPVILTESVENVAGGVSIWVNRIAPERSLILGLDSVNKTGGLVAFGLDGKKITSISSLNLPTGIDVEYDFSLGKTKVDLAVVAEAGSGQLRVLSVDQSSGELRDISGKTAVLGEGSGDEKIPQSIGLFRRADSVIFAIVAAKSGPKKGSFAQYRLEERDGKVDLKLVRRFGESSSSGVQVAVDDALGLVYFSDSKSGLTKYLADPDAQGSAAKVAGFGTDGYQGERAGMVVMPTDEKNGFLLGLDKTEGKGRVFVFSRTGTSEKDPANRLIQGLFVPVVGGTSLAATQRDLGKAFPEGVVLLNDPTGKRFAIFDWREVAMQITRR